VTTATKTQQPHSRATAEKAQEEGENEEEQEGVKGGGGTAHEMARRQDRKVDGTARIHIAQP
jgi:hypothetical protein